MRLLALGMLLVLGAVAGSPPDGCGPGGAACHGRQMPWPGPASNCHSACPLQGKVFALLRAMQRAELAVTFQASPTAPAQQRATHPVRAVPGLVPPPSGAGIAFPQFRR